MELKLVSSKMVNNAIFGATLVERYEIEDYEVKVNHLLGEVVVSVTKRSNNDRYLPSIIYRDDEDGNLEGFDIQTTSYGALSIDEIEKMVNSIEKAVKVVEILTEKFVKIL